jgi:Domain of Unknown Function (DUF928)
MYSIKSLLCILPFGLVLELTIALNATAQPESGISRVFDVQPAETQQVKLKQSNPPPPPTNPDSSAAGGRRDPSACPQDAAATRPLLTALSPTTKSGLTLAERPTFLVYVPKTSAETAEFSLGDRQGHGLYRTTVTLTHTPDLIRISLPAQAAPLELNQQYTWSFAIICNPADRVEDQFVTGSVQRIELSADRLQQIEQAAPKQRIVLYQENGIWYDALALLLELQRSQPNDPDIQTIWGNLLQVGGVDTLIETGSN